VTTVDPDLLAATRRSLHAVAEQVLAAALHRSTGRIGLRATPGGFGTPPFDGPDGVRQVRVDGVELVTTIAAAAALVGVDPGGPADVYALATPLEPDRPLAVDPAAAQHLAGLFSTVDVALGRLVGVASPADGPTVQLWPEHFDLATTIDEVSYGGSPGDDEHPLPYLYVGPWSPPPPDGGFWNEPFGASLALDVSSGIDGALAFFEDGRARLRARD
jgi:hypothetical protein